MFEWRVILITTIRILTILSEMKNYTIVAFHTVHGDIPVFIRLYLKWSRGNFSTIPNRDESADKTSFIIYVLDINNASNYSEVAHSTPHYISIMVDAVVA